MKKFFTVFTAVSIILFSLSFDLCSIAQTPPPPNNGNAPGTGNNPVGGGAPIGGGVFILSALAIVYGIRKKLRKKNVVILLVLAAPIVGFSQTNGGFKWMEGISSAVSNYPGSGITTDDVGNIYVTGTWSGNASFGNGVYLYNSGNNDGYLAKYSRDGKCFWAKKFNTNNFEANGVALSYYDGAIYLAGYIDGSTTFGSINLNIARDYAVFLAKADTAGDFAWAKSFEAGYDNLDITLTNDNAGDVIIAFSFMDTLFVDNLSYPSLGNTDIFVAKYSNSGIRIWSSSYGDDDSDYCMGATNDEDDNIYITGTYWGHTKIGGYTLTSGLATIETYFAKLNPTGGVVWAKRAGGTRELGSQSIDCDQNGSIYATGRYWGTATFGTHSFTANNPLSWYGDAFIVKADYDGNFIWAVSGGGDGHDEGKSIIADESGNVYVTGTMTDEATFGPFNMGFSGYNEDMFLVKLNENGAYIWANSSEYNSETTGTGMAKGLRGNLYCFGTYNYFVKFDTIDVLSQNQTHSFLVNYTTENIWLGNTSDWNNTANWSFGHIPTSENFVYVAEVNNPGISYYPEVKTGNNAVAEGVEISADAYLDVQIGASLTCEGPFINNGEFILRSNFGGNASFIDNGIIENNNTITISKYIEGDDWHLISSPVENAKASVFMNSWMQSYSEPNQEWTDIIDPDYNLIVGQGYDLYANQLAIIYEFTGTPNTGKMKLPIMAFGSTWNLLGNPYPSSVDWDLVPKPANMYEAIYYLDASSGNYVSYINGVGTGSRYVPPMHGFWVEAHHVDTLVFTNDYRVHTGANTNYKSKNKDEVILSVNGNGDTDKTYIYFNDEATDDFDRKFDARKLFSYNEDLPQLYTISNNTNFSVNALHSEKDVQLALKVGVPGNYCINLENCSDNQKIYIEDIFTGTITDLTKSGYCFNADITDPEKRFIVHFDAAGIIENNKQDIYIYNNTLYLNEVSGINDNRILQLFDLQGKLIKSEAISPDKSCVTIEQIQGWYLVRLINNEQIITRKIFIK